MGTDVPLVAAPPPDIQAEPADHTCLRRLDRPGPFGALLVEDVVMRPDLRTTHCHDALHLCLVLEGGFEQRFSTHSTTLSPATVRISPPDAPADLRFSAVGARCFYLEYRDVAPSDLKFLVPEAPAFLSDAHSTALACKTYEAFCTEGEAPLVLDTLILELFARAARTPALPPPDWLRRVRDWLHDGYARPLALADAAVAFGITPVHLSRAFRQHYGCTMGDYLRVVRLGHVRRALREAQTPLVQVALDAGFHDQSHMSRTFKQAFGVTPGAYRQTRGIGTSTSS